MTPALDGPARLAGAALLRLQRDERLAELVRHGHTRAFEVLLERYRKELLAHARRIAGEARAEDVLQTAFVNADRALRDATPDNLRAWLHRVVHNAALNALRDPAWEEIDVDVSAPGADVAALVESREQVRSVFGAMQELPERQREALVMRELEGRGHDEIADLLGVRGGAARQLIHRARMSVRAAATALTPTGLLLRLPFEHAAEAGAAGVGLGLVAKVAATATLGGAALAGGTAGIIAGTTANPAGAPKANAADVRTAAPAATAAAVEASGAQAQAPAEDAEARAERRARRRAERADDDRDDSRRRRSSGSSGSTADDSDDDDRSRSDDDDSDDDRSGSGSDDDSDDRTGSDSGEDSESGGSGSGSGEHEDSTPESSGSGSGEDSGSHDGEEDSSGSGSGSSDQEDPEPVPTVVDDSRDELEGDD